MTTPSINPIIKFLSDGGKINSLEGKKLIKDCELSVITQAIDSLEQEGLSIDLATLMNETSNDPFLRRKIMQALAIR